MSFFGIVNQRFSHRGYSNKHIEDEKLKYILDCTSLAPSAANRQPWKIYIVKDESIKKFIHKAYERDWFAEAPLIAVFTGLKDENWIRNYDQKDYLLCDVTIIADYFILAATEQGLGTCYIAAFNEEKVKNALNLPENEIPLLLTPLGYAKDNSSKPRARKEQSSIITLI